MDSGGECGVLAETMFYVPAVVVKLLWPRVLMSAGVVTTAMPLGLHELKLREGTTHRTSPHSSIATFLLFG
jgi:hypothetical protein